MSDYSQGPTPAPLVEQPITWAYVVNRLIPGPVIVVSMLLIFGFFGAYVLVWADKDTKALDLMNGALIAGFAGAWGYWLGSSRGSAVKDQTVARLSQRRP